MVRFNRAFFFINTPFRLRLYKNVARYYPGVDLYFICFDSFTFLSLQAQGYKNTLLIRGISTGLPEASGPDLTALAIRSSEYLSMVMGKKSLICVLQDLKQALTRLELCSADIIFAGNGYHASDLLLKALKPALGFKTIFTELSNIDGKVFFDPRGANANSLLYDIQATFVTEFPPAVNDSTFDKWVASYVEGKMLNNAVRQSAKNNPLKNIGIILTGWLDRLLGVPSLYAQGGAHSIKKGNAYALVKAEPLPQSNFVFVPLQLSNDTQLLINSDYDNVALLRYYCAEAKSAGLSVVVKMHPSEHSLELLATLELVKKELGFYFSKENSFFLASRSQYVGVNNSTVGLEAVLAGLQVKFIGRTFYQAMMGRAFLKSYIFSYLFEADFFSGTIRQPDFLSKVNFLIALDEKYRG